MKQIAILYKIKLKNKCKFYKSFFSINSVVNCYRFFIIKEIVAFLLTSIILFFFFNNIDAFGLSETAINVIIMVFIFIQLLGYNKSTYNYIFSNMDLYRISSDSFCKFFRKTILEHCIVDFCFKLPTLVSIIIFACIWSPKSIIAIVLSLLLGFLVRANQTLHSLTKDIKGRLGSIVSFLKSSFGLLIAVILFTIGFNVIKATLNIVKVMLTTSIYEEATLLNDVVMSFINPINWFKELFLKYLPIFIFYFIALLLIPVVYNIINYKHLWNNQSSQYKYLSSYAIPYTKLNSKHLPFLKEIFKSRLNTIFLQMKKQPEIIVWIIIEIVIMYNLDSDLSKFIFILWSYYIGNSNYIRSLFVVGNKAFSNYSDNVDLYYWRLVDTSILEVYKEKLNLLYNFSYKITWFQSILACILSLFFMSNWILVLLSLALILLMRKPIQSFNCKLVSFSSFFTFANACKSKLRTANLDESELIEDKLQNILKLPFTLIPMIIIVLNYIYSFLTIPLSLLVVLLFFLIAYLLNRQIDQYIRKAGDILEKVNVLD